MHENQSYKFWREKLGSPRLVVAPMVDQSELPWRLLSRKYKAELCYTPMLHASVFVKDQRYRKESLQTCKEDRPLIVQFCANDAVLFAEACKLAAPFCDAIDLNIGCPQAIARRGHYGAFLQEEWNLLKDMVHSASQAVDVPITCKIRVFEDIDRTVQYARMLEAAGCQLLTVHGRTREQKGAFTGVASWEHIKAVKANVEIPVFANGNIQYLPDVFQCIKETGVDGVMAAEGNLHNPALFCGINPPVWEMCKEYLELVKQYPCPISYVRGHIFKLCHHCLVLDENKDLRQRIAVANDIIQFEDASAELKNKYEKMNAFINTNESLEKYGLPYPPWICQPYVRPPPDKDIVQSESCSKEKNSTKRPLSENSMSRKKLKKLQKNPNKQFERKNAYQICSLCSNPKGSRCLYELCKSCCKAKTLKEILDCPGHRFLFKMKSLNELNTKITDDVTKIISDDSFSSL